MSLRPIEITQLVAELSSELAGAFVQKLHCPSARRCYLELRQLTMEHGQKVGRSVLLCLCTEPQLARLSVVETRAAPQPGTTPFQARLRQELVGARLLGILQPAPTEIALQLQKQQPRTLFAELGGRGDLVLLDEAGRVIAAGDPRFRLPRAPGDQRRSAPGPSRLEPQEEALPLAKAAERLVGSAEAQLLAERAREAAARPLRARLAKLERTVEKVRAEADRSAQAEEHRRAGDLLRQNLGRVERGARKVRLTEYTAEGPREVELELDAALSPRENAERHFHQYRRLLRGGEHARARLQQLEAERDRLARELASVAALEPSPASAPAPPPKRTARPVRRPFKEYAGSGGRILVGKGAADNDELTFKLARPGDLWLHARGVGGAHVILPLARGASVGNELLLDAAHLAVHHSDAKREQRAEVSYTQVKFVRKVKGGAPGQVTFTREKTFLLRVDPARLSRLLATET